MVWIRISVMLSIEAGFESDARMGYASFPRKNVYMKIGRLSETGGKTKWPPLELAVDMRFLAVQYNQKQYTNNNSWTAPSYQPVAPFRLSRYHLRYIFHRIGARHGPENMLYY